MIRDQIDEIELACLLLGKTEQYENDEVDWDEAEQEIYDKYEIGLEQFGRLAKDLVLLTDPFVRADGSKHYCYGELLENGVFRADAKVIVKENE